MTNYALEQALGDGGIEFIRAKVGDRFVHQALVERDGMLGGEASGHLLCLDSASTGDAIVAALQVLEVLVRQGRSLGAALAGYQPLPQKTVNVRIAADARAVGRPSGEGRPPACRSSAAGKGPPGACVPREPSRWCG